jgi:hypothetical protein
MKKTALFFTSNPERAGVLRAFLRMLAKSAPLKKIQPKNAKFIER